MVIRIVDKDKIISRVFRSGHGGSINLIIPKIFVLEMGLEPSDDVSIFFNRTLRKLEIKKESKPSITTTDSKPILKKIKSLRK